MDDLNYKNCIYLGIGSSKLAILDVLDLICRSEGSSINKEKIHLSSRYTDSLDYLRTEFRIKIDNATLCNNNINNTNVTKRILKRKLFMIRSRYVMNKDTFVQCLTPLMNQSSNDESKCQDVLKWHSEKLVATKISRHELSLDAQAVYINRIFYKTRSAITFDRSRIVFDLFLKDWYKMDLPTSNIKCVTVYSKSAFLKLFIRTNVADDLQKLYVTHQLLECDVFRNIPKKSTELRNVMIIFTNSCLSRNEYHQLVSLLGFDRVLWNESVVDRKDLLENVFYKKPDILGTVGLSSPANWSAIFQSTSKESNLECVKNEHDASNGQNKSVVSNKPSTSTPVTVEYTGSIFNTSSSSNGDGRCKATNGSKKNTEPVPVNSPSTSCLMYAPGRNISNIFDTFHYNPSPDSGVIIRGSDLLCLNLGQHLNDIIINFYLNYIRYEIMTEDQRQRTHLFNVFFNTKLQGSQSQEYHGTMSRCHERVAKWTKRVDIFDKDFLLIPINENEHWFLAIVCFPWMAGMISYDRLFSVNTNQTVTEIPVNTTVFATKYRKERVKRLQEQYGVSASPCILVFDSLQYQNRASNVKLIRDYLKSEWDYKRSATDGPLVFDKNTIRGFNPQVPQQTNSSDCGVFVLHYVEQFFQNPLKVFTKEYFQSSLLTWFDNETVSKKRATMQRMILAKADSQLLGSGTLSSNRHSSHSVNSHFEDSGCDTRLL